MGLNLVIDANVDDYSVTTGKFDGFKVMDFEKNWHRKIYNLKCTYFSYSDISARTRGIS